MAVNLTKPYDAYIEEMVRHYVIAGLWTTPGMDGDLDDDGDQLENLDDKYGPEDMSDEAMASIEADCTAFVLSNWSDLRDMDPAQAGHDFLLTRDHHGVGFWDRGLGERGDRLTAASHPYGDSGFYVGDDGQVHVL